MELLSVKQLNLAVNGEEKIRNGSFSVHSGDVVLLSGPNGCGKSTIIKLLMGVVFDYHHLDYEDSVALYKMKYDILKSEKSNEMFRRNVCYISQEDDFDSTSVLECFVNSIYYDVKSRPEEYVFSFIKQFSIQYCFEIDPNSLSMNKKCRRMIKTLGLSEPEMDNDDFLAVKYLSQDVRNMSGGQKKLTHIFSLLVKYPFCDLLLLDEPLNNLDYTNVRFFSNVLTKIFRSKPELGIVLVTHCRSIPIINRVLYVDPVQKNITEEAAFSCSSCFGTIDENGLYR